MQSRKKWEVPADMEEVRRRLEEGRMAFVECAAVQTAGRDLDGGGEAGGAIWFVPDGEDVAVGLSKTAQDVRDGGSESEAADAGICGDRGCRADEYGVRGRV
jgi:hypothetical protein